MKRKLLVSITAMFVAALAFTPVSVFARDGTGATETNTATQTSEDSNTGTTSDDSSSTTLTPRQESEQEIEKARAEAKQKIEQAKSDLKDKLDAARLQKCENRTTSVNTILSNNAARAKNVLARFEAIAAKVEAYVKNNNLTVPNYDALVADVNAKDAAAAAAIGAVSGTTFSCDTQSANAVGQFQTGVIKDELNALKAYRTSIKNLIAAVKTAAEQQHAGSTSTGANQ